MATVMFNGAFTSFPTFDDAWDYAVSLPSNQNSYATIIMHNHVVISASKAVSKGKFITLDLNGKTLDRGLSGKSPESKGYSIGIAAGGDFVLTDSGTDGKITGGNSSGNGGAVNSDGKFTMNGGKLTGNSSTEDGGAICGGGNSTTTINGGEISNNTAKRGGAIKSSKILNIYGGIISENHATGFGGGAIYVGGTTTIYGGTIKNNICADSGGGVLVGSANAKFEMIGGTITGNKALAGGGWIKQQ